MTADVYDDMLQWSGLDRGQVEIAIRGQRRGAPLQPDKFDTLETLRHMK